jgi:hypothetical protein
VRINGVDACIVRLWLEQDTDMRLDTPSEPVAVNQTSTTWEANVRRGSRLDQPDLHWMSATTAIDLAALPVQAGDMIVRKAHRAKPNPVHGTAGYHSRALP